MLSRLSFHNKIFIYYSTLIIFILFAITALFYSYISNLLQNNAALGMSQTIDKISSSLDAMIKEIDTVSTQVLYNEDIQNVLMDAYDNENNLPNFFDIDLASAKKTRATLVSINSPKTNVRRIGIFNEKGSFISVGTASQSPMEFGKTITFNDWYDKIINSPTKSILLPPHKDNWSDIHDETMVISLVREILSTYGAFNHLGYVEVQQPYSKLEEIGKDNNERMHILVLDEEGSVIYPIRHYTQAQIAHYLEITDESGKIIKRPWDGVEELIYSKHSSYTQWTTFVMQPKKDFMSPVYFLRNILLLSGFILIALTLLIIHFITKSLTAPIKEMRKLVKELSLDNIQISLSGKTRNNEVYLLNKAFNQTLIRLKESMDQTVQARAGEVHAHMLALQAQINPHFLYNTLMSISAAGQEAGSRKIMLMCSQLSYMMRYAASFQKSTVTLSDELQHAESYLKLMKFRYEDWLDYSIRVDERLGDIQVPKLIIQPVIENCFTHAFKDASPPFRIQIHVYFKENSWFIQVKDNGKGFDPESIKIIQLNLEKYKIDLESGKRFDDLQVGGLGLNNIYIRLMLLYGTGAIFDIRNNAYAGGIITLGGDWKEDLQ
ncbi:sensor histidine kinase [Cohnella silvisoli]|uniref:Histidine kinase n=1 Tax=Cohnella silvisoli TaxID=2873699 RepID=A0ABV1KUR0_9BACL|nr:sensor histidine kinase [Cohnella silvisoli]MCD9021454.1 histidine kinase [Cohnella silvisoli]